MATNVLQDRKILFALLLVCVLMVSVGGVLSSGMMHEGHMQNCPFMGITAICNMNALEHLSGWQRLFTMTPHSFTTLILLLLLSFVVGRFVPILLRRKRVPQQPIFYVRYFDEVFDPMKLAFARGLIHPKVF